MTLMLPTQPDVLNLNEDFASKYFESLKKQALVSSLNFADFAAELLQKSTTNVWSSKVGKYLAISSWIQDHFVGNPLKSAQ